MDLLIGAWFAGPVKFAQFTRGSCQEVAGAHGRICIGQAVLSSAGTSSLCRQIICRLGHRWHRQCHSLYKLIDGNIVRDERKIEERTLTTALLVLCFPN